MDTDYTQAGRVRHLAHELGAVVAYRLARMEDELALASLAGVIRDLDRIRAELLEAGVRVRQATGEEASRQLPLPFLRR